MTPTPHDPGSKARRMALLSGTLGAAEFAGIRDEHRLVLMRYPASPGKYTAHALWCGMNPSRASAEEDDLTVRKEQEWTRRLGLERYVKVNIGSYRSTDPRGLAAPGVVVAHPANLPVIRHYARTASIVILACGDPPDVLLPHARTVVRTLKADGVSLLCLGVTKAGWPKHSSRLAYATPLVNYRL